MDNNAKTNLKKSRLIKRRRVFFLRRMLFIFLVFIIFLLVLVNSSIFNIKKIEIIGNKFLTKEYVLENVGTLFQKNILFESVNKHLEVIKDNKYIENISYTKKIPNTIVLKLDETHIDYYIYNNEKYYIFDRTSTLLDILDNINEYSLIEIVGVDFNQSIEVGRKLFEEDSREVKWLMNISELMDLNMSGIEFNYIDLSDVYDVDLGYNKIKINIGSNSNLKQKLNNALNILNSNEKFSTQTGYIDVRSKSYPVVSLS